MATQDIQLVITGKVRLSFTHLFSPYSKNPTDKAKYSTTILLPKSDFATKQRIDAAISAAIAAGIGTKWGGIRPPIIPHPVHDGDGVRPSDGMPFGEECKGHWVFTASSENRAPQLVDLGLNPIMSQSEIYSGVYARVSVRFYPYLSNNKRGIGCGLNNVQKLEDGPSLGGGTTATSDFGDAQGAAYPQAAPNYAAPTYPNPAAPTYPQAASAYPPQQQAIDPITGRPVIGQVMGL